jgi:hypothetical protein
VFLQVQNAALQKIRQARLAAEREHAASVRAQRALISADHDARLEAYDALLDKYKSAVNMLGGKMPVNGAFGGHSTDSATIDRGTKPAPAAAAAVEKGRRGKPASRL